MRACLGLTYLLICALPAGAADLTKIERVVGKEPKYQGKPKYCLLVFGPEAKFRAWVVLDGKVLYVDRDGSGDLTQPGKRVATYYQKDAQRFGFQPGELTDGKSKYNLGQLRVLGESCDMSVYFDKHCLRAGMDGPGPLKFAERAQDAPIIHFGGPLTLQRFEPQEDSVSCDIKPGPLFRGRPNQVGFSLGTPGLGSGSFAKLALQDKIKGSVEVRFAGGKTITESLEPDD
jgi:hypothetical protein